MPLLFWKHSLVIVEGRQGGRGAFFCAKPSASWTR